MKSRFFVFAALTFVGSVVLTSPLARALETPAASTYLGPTIVEIEQWKTVWADDARDRDVPVKVFYPRGAGPFPLIVLSHGLGGSRDGLDYLGRSWAARGYVCAQLQHPGTDEAVWRGATTEAQARQAMTRAASDVVNIINRPRDVSFAIDQLLALNADTKSQLHGKINANQIGVAGHSLGGLTALFSAGQRAMANGFSLDFSDPRIKACLAMSAPLNDRAPLETQFALFKVPCFSMVGQDDNAVLGVAIAQRQIYDVIQAPEQYLLILADADHMTFAGERLGPDRPGDARDQALIESASLAFWETQLKGNGAAKSWLQNEFKNQLSQGSIFESK